MSETLAHLSKLASASQALRKVASEKKAFAGAALRAAGSVVGTVGATAVKNPLATLSAVSTAGAAKKDFKKNMAGFKDPGVP